MIHSKSQIKAIIKRAITDQESFLANEPNKVINKLNNSRKVSLKKYFEMWKRFSVLEFQNSLILESIERHKILRKQTLNYFYIDLSEPAEKRQEDLNYYPAEFIVRHRRLVSGKSLINSIEEDDKPFIFLSTHAIERLIERSGADTFREAIKSFAPVCMIFFNSPFELMKNRLCGDKYILYSHDGYFVFKYILSEGFLPIILTWLPAEFFTDTQFNKFINLKTKVSKYFFIIKEDVFNSKKVLNYDDIYEIK